MNVRDIANLGELPEYRTLKTLAAAIVELQDRIDAIDGDEAHRQTAATLAAVNEKLAAMESALTGPADQAPAPAPAPAAAGV